MESIEQKLLIAPDSEFINSLRSFYKQKGFLTEKQMIHLDRSLENKFISKQTFKRDRYEDKDPETLEDLLL